MAVAAPPVRGPRPRTAAVESTATWRRSDRVGLVLCWAAGIALCLIVTGIVGYMLLKGAQYLRPNLLIDRPVASVDQAGSGGFLDPIIGTIALIVLGIALALPLGVATAVWVVEYGRPTWLARAVESGIEVIAGTPSIVLALFGLVLFSRSPFGILSFTAQGGGILGRSFLTAGAMMALIALPLVVASTREALSSIPGTVREASYALGKTKAATIRRVLLPTARPGVATGAVLGMGRIAGDTAVVVVLLGATLQLQPAPDEGGPLGYARGTGSTLTSYVYNNSPAGEGNAPQKAYAAAVVLLLVVVGLNFLVERIVNARPQGTRRTRRLPWTR